MSDGQISAQTQTETSGPVSDHFERGLKLYHDGETEKARGVWREGVALDPENWNMRKQLWAIENPDKFYSGKVDYSWQREQVEQGR